jgi:hypothetical protein
MRDEDTYIVICKEQGTYILVTREVFVTKEAAEAYRDTCSPSREALVIPGDFRNLRIPPLY